jgi:hypothetical protein
MADFSSLTPIAEGLLEKAGGDVARALPNYRRLLLKRPDLLDVLALAHLEALAHPVPGQPLSDAQKARAGNAAAGQSGADALHTRAGGGSPSKPTAAKPIKVHEFRRARARTAEEMERQQQISLLAATKNLEGSYQRQILDRGIGGYAWRELPEAGRQCVANFTGHLWMGARAAEDAILIDKLLCYAAVDDLNKKVSEVVPAEALARMIMESSKEFAPKLDRTKGVAHGAFVEQLEYHPS